MLRIILHYPSQINSQNSMLSVRKHYLVYQYDSNSLMIQQNERISMVQQFTQQIHSLWTILETTPEEQLLFQENVKSDLSNETITYVYSSTSLSYLLVSTVYSTTSRRSSIKATSTDTFFTYQNVRFILHALL